MQFKDIVAISGMGGLHEIIGQRPNGMIVKQVGDESAQNKFVSNRIHTFSPLDKISIYIGGGIVGDSVPLIEVMAKMLDKEQAENVQTPASKASSKLLKAYLRKILPDYDESRVYVSDIKKIIKWYAILKTYEDIFTPPEPEPEEETTTEEQTEIEATEEQTEIEATEDLVDN